jgi:hypothetical protein
MPAVQACSFLVGATPLYLAISLVQRKSRKRRPYSAGPHIARNDQRPDFVNADFSGLNHLVLIGSGHRNGDK